jgi:hypothetical protein
MKRDVEERRVIKVVLRPAAQVVSYPEDRSWGRRACCWRPEVAEEVSHPSPLERATGSGVKPATALFAKRSI